MVKVTPSRFGKGKLALLTTFETELKDALSLVNPKRTMFVELCQKKRSKDKTQKKIQPFRLVSAIPVDMFPHTDHCELVLTFER